MKAIVWHGIGDIRLDDVPEPRIEKPTDAIVRLTASAICGTDLHMIHGTLAPMKVGTILGHEGVGVIEELGGDVRNFTVGDRVLIPSTIACGNCAYCRAGCYSQCDSADRAIDAVGVDALRPHRGPATAKVPVDELERERHEIAPDAQLAAPQWVPGDGPSLVLTWAVDGVCKNGTVAVIGVYPETAHTFPIGKAMNKNLTLNLGNCDHRKIIPIVLDLVRTGVVEPTQVRSHVEPISAALDAYSHFDHRDPGWIKVELKPQLVQ